MDTNEFVNGILPTGTTEEIATTDAILTQAFNQTSARQFDNFSDILTNAQMNPSIKNDYVQTVINKVGLQLVSKLNLINRFANFKMGKLPFGHSAEETHFNLIDSIAFDPNATPFGRFDPTANTKYHIENRRDVFPITVDENRLNRAMQSLSATVAYIAEIVNLMVTSNDVKEELLTQKLLENDMQQGNIKKVYITREQANDGKELLKLLRDYGEQFAINGNDYTQHGVWTRTPKENIQVFMDTKTSAIIDVDGLATAFNFDKANYIGRVHLFKRWGIQDEEVVMGMLSKDYWKIWDILNDIQAQPNAIAYTRNLFYHLQQIWSTSPFQNAIMFVIKETEPTFGVSGLLVTSANGRLQPKQSTTIFAIPRGHIKSDGTTSDVSEGKVGVALFGNSSSDTIIDPPTFNTETMAYECFLDIGADERALSVAVEFTLTNDDKSISFVRMVSIDIDRSNFLI